MRPDWFTQREMTDLWNSAVQGWGSFGGISICSSIFMPWPLPRVLFLTPDFNPLALPSKYIPNWVISHCFNYTAPCGLNLHFSPGLFAFLSSLDLLTSHMGFLSCQCSALWPGVLFETLNPNEFISPISLYLSSAINCPLVPTILNFKSQGLYRGPVGFTPSASFLTSQLHLLGSSFTYSSATVCPWLWFFLNHTKHAASTFVLATTCGWSPYLPYHPHSMDFFILECGSTHL